MTWAAPSQSMARSGEMNAGASRNKKGITHITQPHAFSFTVSVTIGVNWK